MNKIERVETVLKGGKPDLVPAGFWFHYNGDLDSRQMADEHLKTFRETGVDIYKVMQDYTQKIDTPVQTSGDWKKVKYPGCVSPVYQKLLDVLKRILDATGGDALTFQTLFGPLKVLVQTYGDDLVMAHCKEAPDLVAQAVMNVADAQTEWAAGFIEAGICGLYYSGQFSEPGRFTRPEFDKLCAAGDLVVLKAAEAKGGRNLLHICAQPEYQFKSTPEWYVNYPFVIVNWSVKHTGISLKKGRELFGGKPVLGGMNNKGNILNGSDESIRKEVHEVINSIGDTRGFMLGADCTIQGKNISHEKIRVAVDAAHEF